ncbi:DUF1707 SHOCT-like domain-containing protein [Mycolicibacterium litorale]|uniref:DUF1707 domain-containing protein n=1 Tax=Mycolicibacterium litorale TaxID=758802 RepID=A0AAD1MTQ0_9MYCO|nr:DUF1707 domain-containing protein [Mycolicibacterium litorale]MCV7417405.1 DUF1707 domain-containing protein [Mycolicibacterium litorale]BBY18629.1 hypothetical protein MLIT_42210 [Mycolicibacterium litorale]
MAVSSSGRPTAGTRAKDSDRNDTCQVLDTALSEGQLSMAEHGERVKAATHAATLGELQALVSDLQTANAPVQLPDLSRPKRRRLPVRAGWGVKAAMAAVLVVLGMCIGWGLYGNTSSPLDFQTDPGAKADGIEPVVLTPPRQLQSLNGLTGLFEQMRQRFGSTMGYELDIRADYASLDRPDPSDNRRQQNYDYRGGWGDPWGSPSTLSSDDRLVDLAKFDYEKTLAVMRGAPDTLGMNRADVTDTWLRIGPSADPATPDLVTVEIVASSDFGTGRIELYPDGSTKAIWPPSS